MQKEDILYALLVVIILLAVWVIWAYNVYRISDDRLNMKILAAFNSSQDGLTSAESKEYETQVTSKAFTSPTYIGGQVTAVIQFIPLPGVSSSSPTLPQRGPITVTYDVLEDSGDSIVNKKNCTSATSTCVFI